MVCDHIAAQQVHQIIVDRRRSLFKCAVGMPVIAHAIHHLAACHITFQKFVQRFDILLQIRVNGHHRIRILSGCHHARKDCALMAVIACQTDHRKQGVLCGRPVQKAQCIVLAPVIDKHDLASRRNPSCLRKTAHLISQHLCRFLDNFFFIVTRHHQV